MANVMSLSQHLPDTTRPVTAMGFDFGTRRIGVAYGQSLTGTARPLPVLAARDGIPDWQLLQRLISNWQPDVLVVGLPYNMDGTDGDMVQRATRFANRLHGRFHLPCYGMDERLSSHAAAELSDKPIGEPLDSLAAQLILESWFAELGARR